VARSAVLADPARVRSLTLLGCGPSMLERKHVTRDQVPTLSFGAGPHYCLGAYLAGLQGEVLFPRLLRRYPGPRLAGEPVYRSPGSTLRGLEHLPVYLRS